MPEQTPEAAGNDAAATAAPQPPAEPAEPPTIEALLELVQTTYRPLGDEELARIRKSLVAAQNMSAAMHAYPLTNADEPDPLFVAYRAD